VIEDDTGRAVRVANLSDVELLDVNVRVRIEWADGVVDDLLPQVRQLAALEERVLPLPERALALESIRAFPVTARTPLPL
jgi:hypothetical protein